MVKRKDMIPGECYEVRCGKCDYPGSLEKCGHAWGDLQYCDCCQKCRALCTEPMDDMFNVHPCTVEEEMTKALEGIRDCICTTGYLCLYCRNKVDARKGKTG